MKSSTLRRSTLSKENMEVIEALAKEQENNGTIGEYLRPDEVEKSSAEEVNKAQEIDLLWQNFKTTQFNSNSPMAYILTGFVIGVVVTSLVFFGITSYSKKSNLTKSLTPTVSVEETVEQSEEVQPSNEENVAVEENAAENTASVNEEVNKQEQPAPVANAKMKKYVVKSGDTGESIIKHFYGAYTPERAEAITKANNLKSLDRINIDQELLIPVE